MTMEDRFGANLRRLRGDLGLSQEDLAWRAQIHRTQVSLLENGNRLPRFFTLIKLAGALGVTPNDLTEGITWTPAEFQPGSIVVGEGGS